jgi:hypothetical protein
MAICYSRTASVADISDQPGLGVGEIRERIRKRAPLQDLATLNPGYGPPPSLRCFQDRIIVLIARFFVAHLLSRQLP